MADPLFDEKQRIYHQGKAQETLQSQNLAAQMALRGMDMRDQMQQNQAILVEQTDPRKIVDTVLLLLKGQRKNHNGEIEKMSEPILTPYGLERAWFYLNIIVNQNTVLSHLEEGEAGKITYGFGKNLIDELALDWKLWGIKDKTWLDSVADCILIPCFLALRRAEGQNEKNWLGKISFENLSNAGTMQPPKKQGWLSKLRI